MKPITYNERTAEVGAAAGASRPKQDGSGRRRNFKRVGAVLLAGTLLNAAPFQVPAQSVDLVVVDVVAVAKGYRTSRLTGRDVFNEHGEEIGRIDDFIIGRDKVLFTVLQVGGFLGIGSHLVALPYKSLDLESQRGRILLKGASKAELKKLPEFEYGS